MSPPTTSHTYRRTADATSIELVTENVPQTLKPNEVLLKIHAVSLNFRDIGMLTNRYPIPVIPQGIPCSDASATVLGVGSAVTTFKPGDHVTPAFQMDRITGREKNAPFVALGGDVDGVLRQYAVFEEQVLTKIPSYLSHEEAATIACAGVTAWTALGMGQSHQVDVALMQGTGGVSMFAVLICLAAGIRPIVTSSSDEKLEQVKSLGTKERPVLGINYRTHPDWAAEAQRLTDGKGVDVVINNVGVAAMEQSFDALCSNGGTISLVGFLGGMPEKMPDCVMPAMMKMAKIQGIQVGSVKDQQDLCDFLAEKKVDLKPLVDCKVFKFEDAADAFKYVDSGAHVGNVVIRVAG
ncbi:Uu.00g026580.m01.CDS01 [Anthostomella pinea]|uniref:Uu.00g026580.m01.CDS01 n=1 Tax=Anthostomella pinea TaxID=933095 RepID=A0AAI8V7K5_9PEZI|nr:Uu.00g026580.m01.CDS01 [Anthostomella pinea]